MIYRRRNGMAKFRANNGFTLLEVLLAFVVFALSFTAVMDIMSGSMRNTVRAREYTEASLIAQSVMDQIGLDFPLEQGANYSGESGDYEWEISIGLYEDGEESMHSIELAELTAMELLQIDLVISWGEPPRERSNYFSTVRVVMVDQSLASR